MRQEDEFGGKRTKDSRLAVLTAKGRKEGTGGSVLKLMVAISYGKGVLVCKPYSKMDGKTFAEFIDNNFPSMFRAAGRRSRRRLFVQDNDPCQNSSAAKQAMLRIGAKLLEIPPRSPDLNPIENIFHTVARQLRQQALMNCISQETFEQFETRVISTFNSIPVQSINNVIGSMNNRINNIAAAKGKRIRY